MSDQPVNKLTALQFLMGKLNASEFESEDDFFSENYKCIAYIMDQWIEYNKKINENDLQIPHRNQR